VAFLTYLATVDWHEVVELREQRRELLNTKSIICMSNLVTLWVKEQPLNETINDIVNGSEDLSNAFWHPWQVPRVVRPDQVPARGERLRSTWASLSESQQEKHLFRQDIVQLIAFTETAHEKDAIVSVLEPSVDRERADRVRCPFADQSRLPVPWWSLAVFEDILKKN